ncbi:hypothetical protein VTL71DRAFT_6433 [Oculimacula yallundae]|uniref:DH domain-containing protein n=1 Tax=Oculimacula yallundae TaxID=86028 RepID=A0ABR4BWY4_9HELO
MDPLSVIASVVGLLAAATKVAFTLSGIQSSVANAPRTIDHALSQVNGVKVALTGFENLLLGLETAENKRIAMIQVDDLVAILTEAVLTFDELEALVNPFTGISSLAIVDRLKWAWGGDEVESILIRLERHKTTLLLMLSIAQSQSDLEAARSRDALRSLVQQVLENNTDLARRLKNLEDMVESRSILTNCFRNGGSGFNDDAETINSQGFDISSNFDALNLHNDSIVVEHHLSARHSNSIFQHSFEADLNRTRVYARTRLYSSDESFTTSVIRTHVWSVFSGLSLSEISNVSVIALPLYGYELKHSHWYMPSNTKNPAVRKTDCVPQDEPVWVVNQAGTFLIGTRHSSNIPKITSWTSGDSVVYGTARKAMVSTVCTLQQRLIDIPSCKVHLTFAAEESNDKDDLDPVSHLWICLRTTDLLIAIYNSTYSDCPLQYPDPVNPAKRPKMVAFKFIEACIKMLKVPPDDCFSLHDLFGDDVTGFMKVIRLINYVLDEAQPTGSDPEILASSSTDPQGSPQCHDLVVRELVETEKNYVQSLQQLHELKTLIEQTRLLPIEEIAQIFWNLNALLDFANTFLTRIVKVYLDPSEEQEWGSLFATHEEAFGVYVSYVAFHKSATATVRQKFNKISEIDHPLTVDATTLEMFLVRPLPRLLKYPLLLKDLRKRLGGNEKVEADLTSGIEALERVIMKANNAIDSESRREALGVLFTTVQDRKSLRIETLGDLILFGRFPIARGTRRNAGEFRPSTKYKVYLFKHVLLACKEIASNKHRGRSQKGDNTDNDSGEHPRLQLKGRIVMKAIVQVKPQAELNNYELEIMFKAEHEVESFTIEFPHQDFMMKWCRAIERQCWPPELSD